MDQIFKLHISCLLLQTVFRIERAVVFINVACVKLFAVLETVQQVHQSEEEVRE